MNELLGSEVPFALLECVHLWKEIGPVHALKKIALSAMNLELEGALEIQMKRSRVVETLTTTLLGSLAISKQADPFQIAIADLIVFLLENSSECFLEELCLEELRMSKTVDSLYTCLNSASSLTDEEAKAQLLGLLYETFQILTEVEEVAKSILTSRFYSCLVATPTTTKPKHQPVETTMVYLDRMMILINLAEQADITNDPIVITQFEEAVRAFFSNDRIATLINQLGDQRKAGAVERLAATKETMLAEAKVKKTKKASKQVISTWKQDWVKGLELDKQVCVVLARLYESVS